MTNKESRVALVTGGTSGIGLAIAQRFQADGLKVAVLDLDRPHSRELAEGEGFTFIGADLSRRADCKRAIEEVVAALGGLDVLVNNAGFQHIDAVPDFPEDTWDTMIHVMLTAPFLLSKYAWPHLKRTGQGRIINVASAHGLAASAGKSAYVAAKHGLIGLTKAVALENATTGVTCNAICPGFVRTPLAEAQVGPLAKQHGVSEEAALKDFLLVHQPSKRWVEVEEVARMALYLVGPGSGGVNGTALAIDGAWTAT